LARDNEVYIFEKTAHDFVEVESIACSYIWFTVKVQTTLKEKIMTRFYRTKIISMALVISGLLVLLPGCDKNGSAEKVGKKIDNVVENISEELDEAAKNTGEELDEVAKNTGEKFDEAVKNTGEELDEAAKNTGEKIEEVSDNIQNAVKSDE